MCVNRTVKAVRRLNSRVDLHVVILNQERVFLYFNDFSYVYWIFFSRCCCFYWISSALFIYFAIGVYKQHKFCELEYECVLILFCFLCFFYFHLFFCVIPLVLVYWTKFNSYLCCLRSILLHFAVVFVYEKCTPTHKQ